MQLCTDWSRDPSGLASGEQAAAESGGKAKGPAMVSMFRAGFHTGYIPAGVLRLTKAQLDGADADAAFGDGFFCDLVFEPIDALGEARAKQQGTLSTEESQFEDLLHNSSEFWEAVAAHKRRASEAVAKAQVEGKIAAVMSTFSPPAAAFSVDDGDEEEGGTSGGEALHRPFNETFDGMPT